MGGEIFKLPCIGLIQSLTCSGLGNLTSLHRHTTSASIRTWYWLWWGVSTALRSYQRFALFICEYFRLKFSGKDGATNPFRTAFDPPPSFFGKLNCKIFRKNLYKGPKSPLQIFGLKMTIPLWNFSENSYDLVAPPFPYGALTTLHRHISKSKPPVFWHRPCRLKVWEADVRLSAPTGAVAGRQRYGQRCFSFPGILEKRKTIYQDMLREVYF